MNERITENEVVTCAIVRDLAPLVADGVASEESEAAVLSHIAHCEECAALLHTSEQPENPAAAPTPQNDQKIMAYIRRRAVFFLAFVTLLGAAAGVMMTATALQFQNFLIMPLVGALAYACFKGKGLLACPAVFAMTALHAAVSCMVTGYWSDFAGFLIYGVIYTVLVLVGHIIGALLTYAFRKD